MDPTPLKVPFELPKFYELPEVGRLSCSYEDFYKSKEIEKILLPSSEVGVFRYRLKQFVLSLGLKPEELSGRKITFILHQQTLRSAFCSYRFASSNITVMVLLRDLFVLGHDLDVNVPDEQLQREQRMESERWSHLKRLPHFLKVLTASPPLKRLMEKLNSKPLEVQYAPQSDSALVNLFVEKSASVEFPLADVQSIPSNTEQALEALIKDVERLPATEHGGPHPSAPSRPLSRPGAPNQTAFHHGAGGPHPHHPGPGH